MPLTFVLRLQVSLNTKVGLCVLLGLGVVSGVCVVIKTILLRHVNPQTDVPWIMMTVFSWHSTEIFLNIVCASIPTLAPLYDKVVRSKPLRQLGAFGPGNKALSQPGTEAHGSLCKPWTARTSRLPAGSHDRELEDIWLDDRSIGVPETIQFKTESFRKATV